MKPSLASAPTVITCHSNADWDALSSMIGMSMIYPDSIMIFPGSMEKPLNQFFNETAVFLYTFKNIKEIDHASVKRVVVVVTQIRSRGPQAQDLLDLPGVEVEVWDHHPTPYSGEKNKVINADVTHIGTTGSTCTLICQALQERGITPPVRKPPFSGSASTATRARSPTRPPSRKISLRGHGCASTAWICPSSLISSRRA